MATNSPFRTVAVTFEDGSSERSRDTLNASSACCCPKTQLASTLESQQDATLLLEQLRLGERVEVELVEGLDGAFEESEEFVQMAQVQLLAKKYKSDLKELSFFRYVGQ